MINDVEDFDPASPAIIAAMREYGFGYELDKLTSDDIEGVAESIRRFMDLSEPAREMFLNGLRTFVCKECGKPSCLCGYSDE